MIRGRNDEDGISEIFYETVFIDRTQIDYSLLDVMDFSICINTERERRYEPKGHGIMVDFCFWIVTM